MGGPRQDEAPTGKGGWGQAAVLLLAVLAVAAVVRGVLISQTQTITRDGPVYIAMARTWDRDPAAAIAGFDYPPAYPVAMLWAHRGLSAAGVIGNGPAGWDLSGQLVSLAAGLVALAGLWAFARIAFNLHVAVVTTLLFALGRKWAVLGADVSSDALAQATMIWAIVLGLLAGRRMAAGRWAIVPAAAVGLLGGAGYLVRPEALVAVLLVGGLWAVGALRHRRRWKQHVFGAVTMLAVLAAVAAPYVSEIGGLSKKKGLSDFVGQHGPSAAPVIATSAATRTILARPSGDQPVPGEGIYKFAGQLTEAMHPVMAILLGFWLATWVGTWVRFPLPPAIRKQMPAPAPAGMMLAGLLLMLVLLAAMYRQVGYLSHRHVMLVAMLLAPLSGAGVVILMLWIAEAGRALHLPRVVTALVIVALMLLPVGGMAAHALGPLHESKLHERQAAEHLAELSGPGDRLFVDTRLMAHYVDRPDARIVRHHQFRSDRFLKLVRGDGTAAWLIINDEWIETYNPALRTLLAGPGFVEVARFREQGVAPDKLANHDFDQATVYRIEPDKLPDAPPPATQPDSDR